ncbi:hypothetical protein [Armatimonas sp.]|uniref:hypothetical protein n=1 Tax=Armatimonas sp. TaxID=1872638 RepID=UPI003752C32F
MSQKPTEKKRRLSAASSILAMQAAQDAIRDTDGIVLAVLIVSGGEDGRPQIYSPTISPNQISGEFVADVADGYASAARESARTGQAYVGTVKLGSQDEESVPVNPLHAHRGSGRGKEQVN